jgi:hypothetical protein
VLPKAVATSLIGEEARALADAPGTCLYARASERGADPKTTVSVLVVANPSVAAAEKVQAATAKLAPKRAPAGVSGFARQEVPTSGGKAFFVYWYVPGRGVRQTITNAQAYLQAGAVIVQLTFDVVSKGGPSFTAGEVRDALPAVVGRLARGR